jgi:hypothetical protein
MAASVICGGVSKVCSKRFASMMNATTSTLRHRAADGGIERTETEVVTRPGDDDQRDDDHRDDDHRDDDHRDDGN